MASDIPSNYLQRFDGSDFNIWKFQVQQHLDGHDLLEVLDPANQPSSPDDPGYTAWKRNDKRARIIITSALAFSQLKFIVTCTSAHSMWTKLSSIYEQRSGACLSTLQQKFYEYRMDEDASMASHLSTIETMAQQLRDLGAPMVESAVVTKIICSLSSKYRHFRSAWDSVSVQDQTLLNLSSRLMKEESMATEDSKKEPAKDAALISKKLSKEDYIKEKKKTTRCAYCHRRGHWIKECRSRQAAQERKDKKQDAAALIASTQVLASSSAQSSSKTTWLIDSGATHHICTMRNAFATFEDISDKSHAVRFGDDSEVYAKGIGNVRIKPSASSDILTLKSVLFVPDMNINLFSVPAADENGANCSFSNGKVWIKRNKKTLITGEQKDGRLYELDLQIVQHDSAHVASMDTWHKRLGHLSTSSIIKSGLDKQLKMTPDNDKFCNGCALGKQHKSSFASSDNNRKKEKGELLHVDLAGPMESESIGNSKYFLLIKDDATRYSFVAFLRLKSELPRKMEEILIKIQASKIKIRSIRSDNGMEFMSEDFKKILQKFSIHHETSSPYCPQQNGFIERHIRTIKETSLCFLYDANVPKKFWAEATNCAVFVRNCTPVHDLGWKSPYEMWFGKSPKYSMFKRFGCVVYNLTPKSHRSNLEPKSKKAAFVGYSPENYSFRIWDGHCVKIAHDLKFDEQNDYFSNTDNNNLPASFVQIPGPLPSVLESERQQLAVISESTSCSDPNACRRPIERDPYPLRSRVTSQVFVSIDEPFSYDEAMECPNKEQWKIAIDEEIAAHEENKTWTIVSRTAEMKPITCKWLFKQKFNANGSLDRYKARLVVRGFSQRPGLDYQETFAPVIRFDSLRLLFSIAAHRQLRMMQFDVCTAFLYGTISEDIYMELPEGYPISDKNKVCKL